MVRVRGERWRTIRHLVYETSAVIEVEGCEKITRGERVRFLLPADSIDRIPISALPRVVRPARWRHAARRARLTYRDVASATNRLTLIALVVPPGVVTTHTLFCLTTPLTAAAQSVLCALLNSFVANYLARMRVSTHVTASLVSRLPAPVLRAPDPTFLRLASLARALAHGHRAAELMVEYTELQAIVAGCTD